MNPLALDLCAGKHGWGEGLVAAGWDVISIDIEDWGNCPGYFMKADVRKIAGPMRDKQGRKISLVVASPPCQEFSYRSFPFKRCRELAATVPPDTSIWRACERIARECNAPLVLENVRGAQKYMGKAKAHYGSLYLWGDVPALLPHGKHVKGFQKSKTIPFGGTRDLKKNMNQLQCLGSGGSNKRKQWSAQAAKIPLALARWIGQCFYPETK